MGKKSNLVEEIRLLPADNGVNPAADISVIRACAREKDFVKIVKFLLAAEEESKPAFKNNCSLQ